MNAYCIKCGHEFKEDEYECTECEYNACILGEDGVHYKRTNEGISCICGNTGFTLVSHVSMAKAHKHLLRCTKCGKTITKEVAVSDWWND